MNEFNRRSVLGLAVAAPLSSFIRPSPVRAEVGVEHLNLNLIATDAQDLPAKDRMATFFRLLKAKNDDTRKLYPSSSCVQLIHCSLDAKSKPLIRERLLRAGDWLEARPKNAFDRWRALGGDVVMEFHIKIFGDDEALSPFDIPAEFILACANAKVPLRLSPF